MTGTNHSFLDDAPSWTVRYRRGQVIFDEGEASKYMYRVDKGCVRLQVNSVDGHRQIVTFLFPEDLFGYDISRHVCAAEAASDVVLTCWSMPSILRLGSRRAEVTVSLVAASQARFGALAQHIERITHLPAKERLLWFFNGLVRCEGLGRPGGRIHLPMNRQDIADFLGLAPETLSRMTAELEAEGYLRRAGRRDIVLQQPTCAFTGRTPADLRFKPKRDRVA